MAQDNEGNETQPKYLTHDDLNGALAAQKKEFQKLMAQQVESSKAMVEEIRNAFAPKTEQPVVASRAELSTDTAELKTQIKLLLDRDKARDETEKAMKLEQSLRDTLSQHGIVSKSSLAIDHLKSKVSYDEDGQLQMKFDDIVYPLKDAVAKFAQTDNGKFLSDPRDIRGSGSKGSFTSQYRPPTPTAQITGSDGQPVFSDLKQMKQYATTLLSKGKIL